MPTKKLDDLYLNVYQLNNNSSLLSICSSTLFKLDKPNKVFSTVVSVNEILVIWSIS